MPRREDLSERQRIILKLIIKEYIKTAQPVSSEVIARNEALSVSSATVRNEMSTLEERGFISHPHTSAGRIPTDLGYRYFVEYLVDQEQEESALSVVERRTIEHQFHQVEMAQSEWMRLAAAVLAQAVQSTAVITPPRATHARLKHLELISVQDRLALLIVVFHEGTIRQQMMPLDEVKNQEELSALAHRLASRYAGLTQDQIAAHSAVLTGFSAQVHDLLLHLMRQQDELNASEVYHNGLIYMLEQPEFDSRERAYRLLELLEQRSLLCNILPQALDRDGVQIFIGSENPWTELREYSLILSRYGISDEMLGVLGVLGPTRFPYARAISSVRHMARVLSALIQDIYGVRESLPASSGS